MASSELEILVKALAVTLELTGTEMSEAAMRVMVRDLARYPQAQVLGAFDRCRKELRGRLTLADVLQRLDDGRPGPEEAWAMIPRDEATSVVWSDEMARAWGVALPLMKEGDMVPARMAFLEQYRKLVQEGRDNAVPPKWIPSLGTDLAGRAAAIQEAVDRGRITQQQATALLPEFMQDIGLKRLKDDTEDGQLRSTRKFSDAISEHLKKAGEPPRLQG